VDVSVGPVSIRVVRRFSFNPTQWRVVFLPKQPLRAQPGSKLRERHLLICLVTILFPCNSSSLMTHQLPRCCTNRLPPYPEAPGTVAQHNLARYYLMVRPLALQCNREGDGGGLFRYGVKPYSLFRLYDSQLLISGRSRIFCSLLPRLEILQSFSIQQDQRLGARSLKLNTEGPMAGLL
jgi:hypothetical protein